ncbi:MAG: hypothetical protein P1V21_27705 [Rhizobiaceae bacterium]|nr:hypothetical protein [Rhizobiaceae bacterium]
MSEVKKNEKTDYILARFGKIRHKRWELYAVTRVVHLLNDPEIEFVCQQLVRGKSGRYLIDLFFPQFNISLEIDEKHHSSEHKEHFSSEGLNSRRYLKKDELRTQEIIDATGIDEERITTWVIASGEIFEKELGEFNEDLNRFIGKIRSEKQRKINQGEFVPWDYEMQFHPDRHRKRGSISLETGGAVFRTHKDALCCFGYGGGNYQRGMWKLRNNDELYVWFPKLYENDGWSNKISEDGRRIDETSDLPENIEKIKKDLHKGKRIVFAHETDSFGKTLYRFRGVFKFSPEKSSIKTGAVVYCRVASEVELPSV